MLTCNLSRASSAASQGNGKARVLGTSYVLDAELAEFADALDVAEVREPVPLHAESALAGRGALGASYQSPAGRGASYVPNR